MKYLLLVCWDAGRMNADTEPDPGARRRAARRRSRSPGLTTSAPAAHGRSGTSWRRRAGPGPCVFVTGTGS